MSSSSSCCNGNCGCGSGCKCGTSCGGCKMYDDMNEKASLITKTPVLGVAPQKSLNEDGERGVGAENMGCPCGAECRCNPCTCN